MRNTIKEEISKEFYIENLIARVISVKKRLDYLIFILLIITCFALYYLNEVPENFILFELKGIDETAYHIIISLIILFTYAIIGSHFIEYVVKRNLIDKELKKDDFFKNKRWRRETENMNVEEGQEKLLVISSMVAPSSLYEYYYTLFVTAKNLRGVAVFVLLLAFFCSHAVAYLHLIQIEAPYYIPEIAGCLLSLAYFLLSREFMLSSKRRNEKLYEVTIKPLYFISGIYVLFLVVLRIWMFYLAC